MNRAVFLDRDGVINRARIENGLSFSPRRFEDFEILSGVKEAVLYFKRSGYLVIVVTNQPEISRGFLKKEELDKMHDHIRDELLIDDIIVCYHDDHHNCDCRKPKPGMLLNAAKKWNIDLKKSYMVGDRWKDVVAGRSAGCKTVLIANEASGECEADYSAISLAEAKEFMI